MFVTVALLASLAIGLTQGSGSSKGSVNRVHTASASGAPVTPAPAFSQTPYPGKPEASPYIPPASAQVVSTVDAPPPLVVTRDPSQQLSGDSPVRYIARNYQGREVGTITIDQAAAAAGVLVSPDGSKLLIGDLVFNIYGRELANLYNPTYPEALVQPIWADDSDHLCSAASGNSTGQVRGALIEFSASGGYREVAGLGPIEGTSGGWSVLACSPSSDRAVLWQTWGGPNKILVLRLSTGELLASYYGGAPGYGPGAASHDGSLVAVNGAAGITILNTLTGQQVGTVTRWGTAMGSPSIAEALAFSWDGSRLLIQSDIAQGGQRWIVSWNTDTTLVSPQDDAVVGAVPLASGSLMFLQEATPPYAAYLLEGTGNLAPVP